MTGSREVAVLTNPTAGRGRAGRVRDQGVARLRSAGWSVRRLEGSDAEEAERLARAAVADGVDALVVCGGDGLVHLGVQAVADTGVPLGILPAGSGNDAARYFDLPAGDGAAAADRLLRWRTREVDLAHTGDRWFVTVLAAGFDAVVNERANAMTRPRGQMRYNLATLAELRTFRPLRYQLDLDGEQLQVEAMLVAVGNGPSYGGGLRIAEGATLDDGLLDVVVIHPLSKMELVRTYPKLFRGSHVDHPQFARHRVRRVTLACPGIVGYADGERFGRLPLTVRSAPGALRVLA